MCVYSAHAGTTIEEINKNQVGRGDLRSLKENPNGALFQASAFYFFLISFCHNKPYARKIIAQQINHWNMARKTIHALFANFQTPLFLPTFQKNFH